MEPKRLDAKRLDEIFDFLEAEFKKRGIKGKKADNLLFKSFERLNISFNRVESEKKLKQEDLKRIMGRKKKHPCEEPLFDKWRRQIIISWREETEIVTVVRVEYTL